MDASRRAAAEFGFLLLSVVGDFEDYFSGIQTPEERLAVTGVILFVSLLTAIVVIPWLSRQIGEFRAARAGTDEDGQRVDPVRSGVRMLAARGVQLGVLVVAALALLLTWGQASEVASFLTDRERLQVGLLANVAITFVVALVGYVAIDVLDEAVAHFSDGADRVTDHQEEVIRRVGQFAVLTLVAFTILATWVEDLSGLLVGAGFLGIVVGMAARQTLGSLIAGFVLMFSRPFTIGDWVEIGEQEGIVTDITIVNTRLENFDGEFVVIPNDMVGNQPITNRSQKGHLRIRQQVGIDYDADPHHAREVALDAMGDVDAIEHSPPPQAVLTEFGDSAVIIELRFWIDRPTPPRKWRATNAVVESVHDAFGREGIKIPFPQRELSGRAETGGFQIGRPAEVSPSRRDGTTGDGEQVATGNAETNGTEAAGSTAGSATTKTDQGPTADRDEISSDRNTDE